MGDGDLELIAHYINRGHTLDELLNLSYAEKEFFAAAWEVERENLEAALSHVK